MAFAGPGEFPLSMVQFWHFKYYIYEFFFVDGLPEFHLTSVFFGSFSLPFLMRPVEGTSLRSYKLPKGKTG